MKSNNILLVIGLPVAITLLLLAVVFSHNKGSSQESPATDNTAFSSDFTPSDTTAYVPSDTTTPSETTPPPLSAPVMESGYLSVKAPKNATVIFDGRQIAYDKGTGIYRTPVASSDTHSLTVSKYGYETITQDIIFVDGSNAEITIDMVATDAYAAEAEAVAKDYLLKIVDICNSGSADLSSIAFLNEEDKATVQSVVDTSVFDMDVDTGEYTTGDIVVNTCSCNGMSEESKTLSPDNPLKGSVVSFTLEYTYTWEYNGSSYQDSGVDSEIHHPIVTVENVDGQWYLTDLYIYFRKNEH